MKSIPIFKAEAEIKGLVENIQSNSSIAYTSVLERWEPNTEAVAKAMEQLNPVQAAARDDDLYYTKSILVSSNWNKNDDVFGKEPVWAARHTPSHKPTNIDHDEKQLVGHISDQWAIDNSGNIIAENTTIDELPDLFHIVNGAVIYTTYQDKELIERTNALIHSIETGKKFVSMECLFSNFSYAIISPEGKFYTLARGEDTAWMTKHLRAYGGEGEYQGYKFGRYLLDITFSGKGYVDNPANENSVIFNDAVNFVFSQASRKNPFSSNSGVLSYAEDKTVPANIKEFNSMADELLKDQNTKLESKVTDLESKLAEAVEKLNKSNVADIQAKVESLTHANTEFEAKVTELTEANSKLTQSVQEATVKVEETEKTKAALETEISEVRATEKKATRVASLVDGGVDKEVAEIKVGIYADLNDEQFENISKDIIEAAKKKDDKKNKDKGDASDDSSNASVSNEENDPDGETNAGDDSLDNVEPNAEPNLTAEGETEDDKSASIRKQLVSFIRGRGVGGKSDESDDSEGEN